MFVLINEKFEGARDFVNELRNHGVNAHLPAGMPFGLKLPEEFTKGPHEVIGVGCSLDPRFVVPLIKIAKEKWPDLKYWHLSSDIYQYTPESEHYQIVIGLDTDVAKRHRIRPFKEVEFNQLDPGMNITDFHYVLRASTRSEFSTKITFTGGIHDGQELNMPYPPKAIIDFMHKDLIWKQPRQDEKGAFDIYQMNIVGDDRIECHFIRTFRPSE